MATNNALNLKNSGLTSYDGAGTFAGRTLTGPVAGITVSNGTGIIGNPTLSLADDLAAIEGLSTTGLATRTGTSTWTTRTIAAGTGVSISNGDGVSGNPTISAGASTPLSFPTDSGTGTPAANALTLAGSGSIATSASGATVTTALTGLTNHALLVGAGTSTITKVGPTATSGQVLQSAGSSADPAFSTATFPSVATGTGTILRADGTNWVATTATYPTTTTLNQILYSSSANTIAGITAANNGTLISGTSGTPSFLANGTTGQVLTATTGSPPSWAPPATAGTVTSVSGTANQVSVATGTTTPVISLVGPYTPATYTAHGVLIGEGTSSIAALAAGSAGQILQSGGSSADPAYSTSTYPTTNAINTILYASSANVMTALATANNGTFITSATGVPSWLSNGTTGQVLTATTGSPPSWGAAPGGGLLTVTIPLTNAQIKALNTTAITILANAGAGVVIVPVSITTKLIYGGTNAFTASGSTTYCYGTTANTNAIITTSDGLFWQNTTSSYEVNLSNSFGVTGAGTAAVVENAAISISRTSAITGNAAANNTAKVTMVYYLLSI